MKNVLIVDDSKTEQMVLFDMLQGQGFNIQMAGNAQEAMQCVMRAKPDLILLDVVMPGESGFQLTRKLGRDPMHADIPVILCTNKSQATDKLWGLRQGARDYITKPIARDELLSKINALNL